MTTDSRRQVLRSTARAGLAAALGALTAVLALRRKEGSTGYCDRAGRCGGCTIQADCDVFKALDPEMTR